MVRARYLARFRKLPNLKDPQDLNEKILWQKLYADTTKWSELADKYRVREYVRKAGLESTLVRLYGAWDDENKINFDELPNSLIFKANNGDGKGSNLIVGDLKSADKASLLKLFHDWLHRKHVGALGGETHYKGIKPMIIAEELLPSPADSTSVVDYKIWCINGKPRYILAFSDRKDGGRGAAMMTYDLDWTPCPQYHIFSAHFWRAEVLPRPKNLERMLEVAARLSKEFPILRVDLYNIDGKIYFGELTFTSLGGMMNYYTPDFLQKLGREADITGVMK
ncbi:MAG: hypothetical protein K2O24_00715 [Muribaculaceae bacterium]|nr:hypothetical protein [Muribaculaceae bacterium]